MREKFKRNDRASSNGLQLLEWVKEAEEMNTQAEGWLKAI